MYKCPWILRAQYLASSPDFGVLEACFGPFSAYPGGVGGLFWAIFGLSRGVGGLFWAIFGLSREVGGLVWAIFGLSRGVGGLFWPIFGLSSGVGGLFWALIGKPRGIRGLFWAIFGLSRGFGGLFWALMDLARGVGGLCWKFGPIHGVVEACFGPFLELFRPIRGNSGQKPYPGWLKTCFWAVWTNPGRWGIILGPFANIKSSWMPAWYVSLLHYCPLYMHCYIPFKPPANRGGPYKCNKDRCHNYIGRWWIAPISEQLKTITIHLFEDSGKPVLIHSSGKCTVVVSTL